MQIRLSSYYNTYQQRHQNNNNKLHSLPSFKGVDFDNNDDANNNKPNKKNWGINLENSFHKELDKLTASYQNARNSVSGFFKNLKREKIDEKELERIDGFSQAQEIFSQEQESITKLYTLQLEALQKQNKQLDKIVELENALVRANRIKEMSKIISENKSSQKGFNSIGGYDAEKFLLTDRFINKLSYERAGEDVELPNGILFFGPNGNGKTSFAKAFAYSAGCEFEKAKAKGSTKEERQQALMDDIIDKAEKAQEIFEKTGNRTIILVDEIDGIANEDSSVLPQLKAFLQSCSQNYHVTIFGTTNNPLLISPAIRNATRFPIKVYLDPPDRTNTIAVLKHYLEADGVTCENIDYGKLADKILEVNPNAAYNNSQLEEICNNCIEDIDRPISTEDLEYQINKMEPGISKTDLEKFKKEKAEIVTNNTEDLND